MVALAALRLDPEQPHFERAVGQTVRGLAGCEGISPCLWWARKVQPIGAFARELAIRLSLFEELFSKSRVGFFVCHSLELKRVLQVLGNHLHGAPVPAACILSAV